MKVLVYAVEKSLVPHPSLDWNIYAAPLALEFTKSASVSCFNQPYVDVAVTVSQVGAFVHTSILKLPFFVKPEMFPKSTMALSIVRLNTGHTFAVTLTPLIEPEAELPSLLISTGVLIAVFQAVLETIP
jgi:hypothetical protein